MSAARVALTGGRWLTGWSVDVPVLMLVVVLGGTYLLAVRQVRRAGGSWNRGTTRWFFGAGLGSLVVVTMSVLGTYDRVLFWALAVQDVLVLTVVPVGLTLGRPVALWRAARGPRPPRLPAAVRRLVAFPLFGSVVAVTLLVLVYSTGWDAARLAHPVLFQATRLLLLCSGCAFLWPLLGVDVATGSTSYAVRAVIALVDGLLDAVPGLAVLASSHLIAAAHYVPSHRTWGPSPAQDQKLGGTIMIGLNELVGLPALLVLLVQWVRNDAREAHDVDAALDVTAAAEAVVASARADGQPAAESGQQPLPPARQRPWWETDPGPLSDRAARYGWGRPPSDDQ